MEEAQSNDAENVTYVDEISAMMHGFGDSPTPNAETVKLVENVIRKQLREMLCEILSKHSDKSFKLITPEDILFYLRYNKHKVQRLMKYVQFKYIDGKISQKINSDLECTEVNKRTRNLFLSMKNYLETIDETGELSDTSSFDAVKYSRNLRAEKMSLSLDERNYMEYVKARCVSFNHNSWSRLQNMKRFNKWVDPQNYFSLSNGTLEILSFLAYGIVANLTDMALIIRENNSYTANDPLRMKIGHYHNSMMFNVPHITNIKKPSISKLNEFNEVNYINKGQNPITVNEIYEVVRRCYMPQVGYMKFSYKSILGKRKICY